MAESGRDSMNTQPGAGDPRTSLAMERTDYAVYRTALAMDRTTLAWIRTTLTTTSFGLGMIAFFRTIREHDETPANIRMHQDAIYFGVALVLLGIVATVLVAWKHLDGVRRLRTGSAPLPTLWPLSVLFSFLLALLAMAGLWVVFIR